MACEIEEYLICAGPFCLNDPAKYIWLGRSLIDKLVDSKAVLLEGERLGNIFRICHAIF